MLAEIRNVWFFFLKNIPFMDACLFEGSWAVSEEPASQKKLMSINSLQLFALVPTTMSVEIKQESQMHSPLLEYEELSPDSRMERRDELDREIEALNSKRKAIAEIDNVSPDDRTLLAVGVNKSRMPQLSDFETSLKELVDRRERFEGCGVPVFRGLEVIHERNFKPDGDKLKPVDECFVRTRSVKEARFLLGLKSFNLMVRETGGTFRGVSGYSVRFVRPEQDDKTRSMYRTAGAHLERLAVVKKELSTIRTEIGDPRPSLSSTYVDKAVYKEQLQRFRRRRAAGYVMNREEQAFLHGRQPVDLAELTARFHKLWDEQVDIYIELRGLQADGLKFEF